MMSFFRLPLTVQELAIMANRINGVRKPPTPPPPPPIQSKPTGNPGNGAIFYALGCWCIPALNYCARCTSNGYRAPGKPWSMRRPIPPPPVRPTVPLPPVITKQKKKKTPPVIIRPENLTPKLSEQVGQVEITTTEPVVEIKIETTTTKKMKKWPENPSELLAYNVIVEPLKDILRKGYRLFRKDEVKNFEYEGFNIGKHELQNHPSPRARFSEKCLEEEKKLGHSLIDVVLNIMFLMGVEQGRRAERRDAEPVDQLLETLENYREKNKNQRIRIDELEVILDMGARRFDLSEEDFKKEVAAGVDARRARRIEELKTELKLDSSRSSFQFNTAPRAKFKELETLALSLTKEDCTEEQWKRILGERGWSHKE